MARLLIPILRGPAMTFSDFSRACIGVLDDWGYATETTASYARVYLQFLTYLKSRGLNDDLRAFDDDNVQGFDEDLARRGAHQNTRIKILSALRTLAKYGMMCKDERKRRLLASDPTTSFRWPTEQRQETKYLYPDELRLLVDAVVPSYKAMARDLLIETGIRVLEAARLKVKDLKHVDGRYYLSLSVKSRGNRRKATSGDIPISKALGEALNDWLLSRGAIDPEAPLLVTSEGQPWHRSSLSNMIVRLSEAVGITRFRVSAHKLRHTREVIDRRAGLDQPTRAKLRLRSSLRSLDRYEHVLPGELIEARETANKGLRAYLDAYRHSPEGEPATQKDQAPNPLDDAEMRNHE